MNQEALVILPGITATPDKQRVVRGFLSAHTDYDVYLPRLWQGLGIRLSAFQLRRFMRELGAYERVHFLAYISGGFILRYWLAQNSFPRVGRIVNVRGPIQEQVPGLVIQKHGRLATGLVKGRMMFDLAADWRNHIPFAVAPLGQGLVIEQGVSKLAAELGLKAADFDRLRKGPEFKLSSADETWFAAESHDEVYTSEALLGRVVSFLKTGKF